MKSWKCGWICTALAWAGAVALFPVTLMAAEAVREETVPSLEERVKLLEESAQKERPVAEWWDRIRIGGLVEAEAAYSRADFDDPALVDEEENDVDLTTVEFAVDVKVAEHVEGHVLFKYEEQALFVDEGYISLSGSKTFPAYLIAGRQYLPFGDFDTHFITDPSTLTLGETNDGALVVGYLFGGERFGLSAGAFNGAARKAGSDEAIDSYVAAIKAQPMEGLSLGLSYTSNLAGSNAFYEVVVAQDNLNSLVGGWSVFISYNFLERFNLIGEYVAALGRFEPGEIYDAADTVARKPAAWNAELGVALMESVELAMRYGGANDGGADFLPEKQYGAVINWGIFDHTNLALEYLCSEFEGNFKTVDTVTAQLAIEF